jgi:NADH-quinone oxidoreductase subunit N
MLMLPELIVIAAAFAVTLTDLLVSNRWRKVLAPMAAAGLLLAAIALFAVAPQSGEMLGGQFAVDAVAWWFKVIFLLAGLLTVMISMDMLDGRTIVSAIAEPIAGHLRSGSAEGMGARGEYYTILLLTVCGMMYLISARDIVMLYVSLELSTIPLFALAAWQRTEHSGEAGVKYLVVGALASSLLLYGLSIVYGLTGHTELAAMRTALHLSPALMLAAAMIAAGVGFKMTIVPFHFWAADVYQGAPTPVTAYLSVASKAAGLAMMFQVFFRLFGPFVANWIAPIATLAAVTMTVGNAIAMVQSNIKRFMAFSAVSQAGYLIMGFMGPAAESAAAMIFYMLVYAVTNIAVFTVIMFISNQTGNEDIADYRGLARTNPVMALGMMIALFGLAGIPPLSGFVGKFFLFSVASKAGYHWLVALAALNSTVSLYYYLRIIRQMYIERPDAAAQPLPVTPAIAATLAVTVVASIALGLAPMAYYAIHASTQGWVEAMLH